MSNKTNFKDLNLSNFFLFPTVMEDQDLCRDMLELCTGEYVAKVQVHTEENRHYHPHKRALRLDVKAWNSQAKYNTEMQNAHRLKLPKRSRYHQSLEDALSLTAGQDFIDLYDNYVIFICTFDPFCGGKYRYIYENRSREENLPLRDGTCKIYLNTKGKNDDEVSKELVHFLKYVENSTDECARKYPDDLFIQRLHQKVREVKRNRDKEMEYMLFGELLDEREELAEERGEKRGEKRGEAQGSMKTIKLVKRMMDDGLTDDIPKLENTEYRKKMMEKYNLL
ncbi:Rpn family recombination-promoting nuclease/putative transposase [Blautia schinkii]|nr:Rpn family recombination-promoting nuclease/putative transposase [Blautia schinkii]